MQTSLEDIAIQTYKTNLQYFEQHQAEIFSKLAAYDSAIEQNLYASKYDLVINDGYFDVLELSTGKYLYNSNSNEYATLVKNSINFQKDSSVFETFKKVTINDKSLEELNKLSIIENSLSGLAPMLHYVQNNIPNTNEMKKIKKFIFFGVGLGLHLIQVHNKIKAKTYLIVEDDLELFKLSLFTVPYYELAQKSILIFSIFDSNKEFSQPSYEFMKTDFYSNHYIKYFQMINQSEDKLQELQLQIASQSHNLFYYNTILEQYLKPLDYLQDDFNFLNILKPIFDEKPILFLAAGPSLYKNIKWIKTNKDKFVIVALSAVLSILQKENISPDIVTHIDGLEESIVHFSKLNSLDFLKESKFLISSRSPREIVDMLNKQNIFFFENGTSYKKDLGNLSAPCVGSTTLLLLLALGIKDMYLIGLDLALDSQTGSTHSHGHEYTQMLNLTSSAINEDLISFKESIIKVDGNLQEFVYTTPEFINSINSINSSTQGFKRQEQTIYNLSDGAYFTNTYATNIKKIEVDKLQNLDKKALSHQLQHKFSQNSSTALNTMEYKEIHKRHENALKVKDIIKLQSDIQFKTSEDFLNSLTTLFDTISRSSSEYDYDLALIYQEYFRFINTFIFDFFNTEGLSEEEKHISTLNSQLSEQLLNIAIIYLTQLNLVLKEYKCKI